MHEKGLTYQCQHCYEIRPNRSSLWSHVSNRHLKVSKSSSKNAQPGRIKSKTKNTIEDEAFNDLINKKSETEEKENKEPDVGQASEGELQFLGLKD